MTSASPQQPRPRGQSDDAPSVASPAICRSWDCSTRRQSTLGVHHSHRRHKPSCWPKLQQHMSSESAWSAERASHSHAHQRRRCLSAPAAHLGRHRHRSSVLGHQPQLSRLRGAEACIRGSLAKLARCSNAGNRSGRTPPCLTSAHHPSHHTRTPYTCTQISTQPMRKHVCTASAVAPPKRWTLDGSTRRLPAPHYARSRRHRRTAGRLRLQLKHASGARSSVWTPPSTPAWGCSGQLRLKRLKGPHQSVAHRRRTGGHQPQLQKRRPSGEEAAPRPPSVASAD
mmetsp:Transcript_128112/g.221006  ORF Transcript_128112/g.221006 Transcript_128112/m.221006 type:complete len:284 (+) Transcript_128112:2-853(+)